MIGATSLLVAGPPFVGRAVRWRILKPERWLALFFFLALLVPPLPLPFGNSGVHIAPAAALLGLLSGFLRMTEWRQCRDSLPILFIAFLGVLAASVALSAVYSGLIIAAGSLARVFLFGIGVYVFLYTLLGPRESDPMAFARFLFALAMTAALFACFDFYFQLPAPARFSAQYVWLGRGVFRRAQGLFYEASTLGNFCAFFIVMILVALTSKTERFCSRAVLVPAGIVFAAALILSSSRASVVTVAIAGGALVYVRRLKIRRALAGSIVLSGAAALAVRILLPSFSAHYWSRIEASFRYLGSTPDGVLSGRITTWKTIYNFLLAHPWHILFGIGYKTMPYTDYLGAPLVADNTYLSLLVETGIVGLGVFLLLNASILRTAFRARSSFFGAWIFCFWVGEMVQMLSGDLITYWRVLPVYFWVLAVAARDTFCVRGDAGENAYTT